MARVLVLASRAKRSADIALLRTVIVTGCALALILAKAPLVL